MNMYPNIFLYMKVSKSNGHTQFHISNLRYLKETWVQPTEPPACKWVSKGCRNSEPPLMADHTATPPTCDLRWATWEMELQRSPIHPIPTSQESDITPPWATNIQCGHDTATGMIWDANSSSTAAVKSARLKSCTAVCQVCHKKMKSTPLSQVSIAANRSYFAWPQAHTIRNTLCRPLSHRCGNDVAAPVATAALLGLAQLDPSRMSTSFYIHVYPCFIIFPSHSGTIQELSTPRAPGLLLPHLALQVEPALALELLPVGSRGSLGQKMTQIKSKTDDWTEEHAVEIFRKL